MAICANASLFANTQGGLLFYFVSPFERICFNLSLFRLKIENRKKTVDFQYRKCDPKGLCNIRKAVAALLVRS